jgi:hypothetical protein
VHFEVNGRLLHRFARPSGLAGDRVISIVPDKEGNIWVATYTGLSRISKVHLSITNYYVKDGLPDNEFNHGASFASEEGDILLGTVSGFVKFDPSLFKHKFQLQDSVRISKIIYGTKEGQTEEYNPAVNNRQIIKLGKRITYVKLFFYVTPFTTSGKPVYEYKIDGIHHNWISMGTEPVLHLDNLKTGTYRLNVRVINGGGSGSFPEKSFPLTVEQYFYTTALFYGFVITAFVLICAAYIWVILKRENKFKQLRRNITEDLHDEIGGYLTGISMNADLLVKNKHKEARYRQTITELSRKALLSLKDGMWSLDASSDTAEQLWDRIKSVSREMLEPLDIACSFNNPVGLANLHLGILEKRNLIFIINECITNAVKYGDGGKVKFEWLQSKGMYTISIENKIKVSLQEPGGGHGLCNIETRMKRIGGNAVFEKREDKFTVKLKLTFLNDKFRNY